MARRGGKADGGTTERRAPNSPLRGAKAAAGAARPLAATGTHGNFRPY